MTLLEVMIAITLLAFVMLGVVSITDNAQNSNDRTILIDRDNLQLDTALARLEWDYSHAWSPLYFSQKFQGVLNPQDNPSAAEVAYLYENHPRFRMPSKEGLPIPFFRSRQKDEIIFLSAGNRRRVANQRQSGFMWVRYYLGDMPEDPDARKSPVAADEEPKSHKALMRQVFADNPWGKEDLDFEDTRGAVLLERVKEMGFSFWNPSNKKWEDNLAGIPDGNLFSRGLRLSISWYDSQGLERTAVRTLRPLWPTHVPQDPAPGPAPQAGAQGGAGQGGFTAGTAGGLQGGFQAGGQGGFQGSAQGGVNGGTAGDGGFL